MGKRWSAVLDSPLVQIPITLVAYSFYACIIGIALIPSLFAVMAGFQGLIAPISNAVSWEASGALALFALVVGGAIYLYFISGILFMGTLVRLLSWGVKPGRYDMRSPTMLRWLIYSGIFMIAVRTILPFCAMTFFSTLFFKILGCKMGKNVYINTPNLNDPMFLELGNNVVIGGLTNLSCHTFEGNKLILGPIKIGDNTLIGTNCYVMPNVTIGNSCNIGMYSYLRKGTVVPDKSNYNALPGLPIKRLLKLERGE